MRVLSALVGGVLGVAGLGLGGCGGAVLVPTPLVLGVGFGGLGVAAEFAQQRIGRCVFFLDAADLGAGALHPFSWTDPVVGLAVALCLVHVSGAPTVLARPFLSRVNPHPQAGA